MVVVLDDWAGSPPPALSKAKSAKGVKTGSRRSLPGGDSVNIQVAVRVRPLPGNEHTCRVAGNSLTLSDPKTDPRSGKPEEFLFDFVYDASATQVRIFEDVGTQILDYAFEGYNGTIFAYGQTGSGKSYSIMGTPADLGITAAPASASIPKKRKAQLSAADAADAPLTPLTHFP